MMRKSRAVLLIPLLLAGCHPPDSFRDTFTTGSAPVLDSVLPGTGGLAEFRFHAPDGDVVVLHRDVVQSAHPRAPLDVGIEIEPAQQKTGVTFTDRRSCDGETGRQTIRAYLIDANHHHSNSVDYSVDCGG